MKKLAPGLYVISLGVVSAFLLEAGELTLVDTGPAGSAEKIIRAVRSLGRRPEDIRRILVTHCHADQTGSLAEMKRTTGAPAYMHPLDAEMVRAGKAMRPLKPSPGLVNRVLFQLFTRPIPKTVEAAEIEHELEGGAELAGGIRAIHTPGHSAGQLAFLWPEHGGVLFVADAAMNLPRLGLSPGYEDLDEGKRSLSKLAALDFEMACFGHGSAMRRGAAARFREKWPG